ncbi:unnamed protein product [Brugia timori]|uniref:Uncharacterized protein n=2 Tax=Brugia TaxID=6278 RepID=A8Q3X4_BRUMA|nr:unnamed protein product [Brugia timori]
MAQGIRLNFRQGSFSSGNESYHGHLPVRIVLIEQKLSLRIIALSLHYFDGFVEMAETLPLLCESKSLEDLE